MVVLCLPGSRNLRLIMHTGAGHVRSPTQRAVAFPNPEVTMNLHKSPASSVIRLSERPQDTAAGGPGLLPHWEPNRLVPPYQCARNARL
jgi:hypothetical protein